MFGLTKIQFYGIIAVLILLIAGGIYWAGRSDGSSNMEKKVVKKQLKYQQKVGKQNAKIDKETPYGGSDDAIANFLLRYTRAD